MKKLSENRFKISKDRTHLIGFTRKGEPFLFDPEDFEIVRRHTWHISKRGYLTSKISGKAVPMHRILVRNSTQLVVDHISRNRLDNRRSNLRLCTQQENSFNQTLPRNNSTGHIGVSFMKKANVFEAYIHLNNKKHHLGLYKNLKDAVMVRDIAAQKYFGEFANLNYPNAEPLNLTG
ncbi:MAG: hypothetical protein HGA49_00275 [Eubacteriaceae bacterium]|nr:hypothetical protein [Eubacteriaceae bacterium]